MSLSYQVRTVSTLPSGVLAILLISFNGRVVTRNISPREKKKKEKKKKEKINRKNEWKKKRRKIDKMNE